MEIAVLLLAAGCSRRMGQDKLALPWGPTTVLETVCQTLGNIGAVQVAVVPPSDWHIRTAEEAGWMTVVNPDTAAGQSASLRCGLAAILACCPTVDGVLCAVADQPLLARETVSEMVRRFHQAWQEQGSRTICRTRYARQPGNPVLWGREWLPELQALTGDEGGRTLLRQRDVAVMYVDAPACQGEDIDTREAYERAMRRLTEE